MVFAVLVVNIPKLRSEYKMMNITYDSQIYFLLTIIYWQGARLPDDKSSLLLHTVTVY